MTRAPRRAARGYTIVENAIAMGVILVAAIGSMGLNTKIGRFFSEAQHATRAAEYAQDLIAQIQFWSFTDPRLADAASNDADLGDTVNLFGTSPDPVADGIADRNISTFGPTPDSMMTYDANLAADDGLVGAQRFINVSFTDAAGNPLDANGNGVMDAMRIAVIVRWPAAGGWTRVVYMTTKRNPAEVL